MVTWLSPGTATGLKYSPSAIFKHPENPDVTVWHPHSGSYHWSVCVWDHKHRECEIGSTCEMCVNFLSCYYKMSDIHNLKGEKIYLAHSSKGFSPPGTESMVEQSHRGRQKAEEETKIYPQWFTSCSPYLLPPKLVASPGDQSSIICLSVTSDSSCSLRNAWEMLGKTLRPSFPPSDIINI